MHGELLLQITVGADVGRTCSADLGFQQGAVDDLAVVEKQGHTHHLALQFADVAWPVIAEQTVQRRARHAGMTDAAAQAFALEKQTGEQGDVVRPLAQRWQPNRPVGNPMIQIESERPLLDQGLERAVARRDHPRLRRPATNTADPVDDTFLQDAQQARLGVGGHVGDLVEKQRAAVGLLEATGAGTDSGRNARLDAEQFGIEQIARQSGTVQCHEAFRIEPGCLMQVVGEQLLAGAGLTLDENVQARGRDDRRLSIQLAHGGIGRGRLRHRLRDRTVRGRCRRAPAIAAGADQGEQIEHHCSEAGETGFYVLALMRENDGKSTI